MYLRLYYTVYIDSIVIAFFVFCSIAIIVVFCE